MTHQDAAAILNFVVFWFVCPATLHVGFKVLDWYFEHRDKDEHNDY